MAGRGFHADRDSQLSSTRACGAVSISRDGLVHRGVGVEAAFEVEDLLEAGSLEGPGDVGAAVAVVADHHGLGGRVELGETLLQLGHRNQLRALYTCELELPRP